MDTSSISGSALLSSSGQTQQALSISMMKQAANQQNIVANMLAQNVRQAPQPAAQSDGNSTFSTYA